MTYRLTNLSDRQVATLKYIRRSSIPPTLREIMRAVGYQSSCSANGALARLERDGLIIRVPNIARGIQLTERGRMYGEPAEVTP